jgi:hypothetical protein
MQRFVLVLLSVVLCSGCFRATTTITVKQDGSGTIDQEVGASAGALAMLRNFSGSNGGQKPDAEVKLFGPEQAQAAAAAMNVRFVSGEPFKTAEGEGYRAHFAFDDVSKVQLNVRQNAPAAMGAEAEKGEPPFVFGFVKKDGSSVLTIKTPVDQKAAPGMLPKVPGAGTPEENAQMMAMVMPMLRGLFVDVTLAVDGRVIKTNAPFVNGSQVTLLQFDLDKVTATEGALQKLQQATDPRTLKDVPGIKMVTDPLITIEFGR